MSLLDNVRAGIQNFGHKISDVSNTYHDQLVNGLAGAAVGGGVGALATDTSDDQPGQSTSHRLRNALTGAVAGGAVGVGGTTAYNKWLRPDPVAPPSRLDKALDIVQNSKPVAAVAAGLHTTPPTSIKDVLNPADSSMRSNVATGAVEGAVLGKGIQSGYDAARGTREMQLLEKIKQYSDPKIHSPTSPSGFKVPKPFTGNFTNAEHLSQLQAAKTEMDAGKNVARSLKGMGVSGKSKLGLIMQMMSSVAVPAASAYFGEQRK